MELPGRYFADIISQVTELLGFLSTPKLGWRVSEVVCGEGAGMGSITQH